MSDAQSGPDVIAFTDEAGRRGYVRDLLASTDSLVGVMVSILMPVERVACINAMIAPLFEQFKAAAPPGAKLHVTAAFQPGKEAWRAVTECVRAKLFKLMKKHRVKVTYSARRMQISREMHVRLEELRAEARAQQRSEYVIPGSNRPSADEVDDDVMVNLALMVDEFAEQEGRKRVDFHFDQIDAPVRKRYQRAIQVTQRVSGIEQAHRARHRSTGAFATGTIGFKAAPHMHLDAVHLGEIIVVGKEDPFTFAADVICNSLYRQLEALPTTAPLNEKSSIQGWALEEVTWCAPSDSTFDQI